MLSLILLQDCTIRGTCTRYCTRYPMLFDILWLIPYLQNVRLRGTIFVPGTSTGYGTIVVSFHIKINNRKLVFCSNEYTVMVCLFLYIIKRWPCYSSTQCTTTSILVLFYYYFVERTQFVCNAAITLNTLIMLHVQFVFPYQMNTWSQDETEIWCMVKFNLFDQAINFNRNSVF